MAISEQGLRELEIWLLGRLNAARGGGLQYHAGTYGPHNIGDWLSVATTSFEPGKHYSQEFLTGQAGVAILTQDVGEYIDHGSWVNVLIKGQDICLASTVDAGDVGAEWYLGKGITGLLYYLHGGQDVGYTEGGAHIRYTRGGEYLVYTTEGGFDGSGDIQFTTSGSGDESSIQNGEFIVDTSNPHGGDGGDINLLATGNANKAGGILIQTKSGAPSLPNGAIKIRADTDLTLSSDGDTTVNASGSATINAPGGTVQLDSSSGGATNIYGGSVLVQAESGLDTTIKGDNVFTQSVAGDIQFDLSANEVHNLSNGGTFVINDHLGSPLVTYTG